MNWRPTRLAAGGAAALVALAVAACGSSNNNGSSSGGGGSGAVSTSSNQSVAKQVPQQYKNKTLTVAADASYPPNEFFASDGKTVIGMDPDLAKALAGVMGVKVKVVNAPFDSIIPGLAAKKYDIGLSSFTDTKEREKTVDFVTYFSAGTSFFVKAQGGPNITGLSSLCGHKIAVEKGTTQQIDATKQAKKCGGGNTQVLTFPDQGGANLALSSGRADVGMADSPVAAYQVKKSNGQFKLTGKSYGTAPYGIAVPKGTGLTKPLLAGMKALDADGTYMKILKKWGIQSGAIHNFQINGATS